MVRVLKRKLQKLKILISSIFLLIGSITKKMNLSKSSKVIFIEISKPEIYHRYYYNLCKYFLIEGYNVVIGRSLRNIYYLKCNSNASLLFKEKGIFIGKPSHNYAFFKIDV